jgi:hypothetical protein
MTVECISTQVRANYTESKEIKGDKKHCANGRSLFEALGICA